MKKSKLLILLAMVAISISLSAKNYGIESDQGKILFKCQSYTTINDSIIYLVSPKEIYITLNSNKVVSILDIYEGNLDIAQVYIRNGWIEFSPIRPSAAIIIISDHVILPNEYQDCYSELINNVITEDLN